MDKCSVLIVGAGPTGLMAACEMARYGISFRIVEKKSEPTKTTNAAGIHTRTLELLDHIGLVDKFVAAGLKSDLMVLYSGQNKLAQISLQTDSSLFKYILMLPQSFTELFLNERLEELGHHVEREREVIGIKQENNGIISTIKHSDGSIETIESDWIIGCDGYHSIVREQSQIPMAGADIDKEFFVADVRVQTNAIPNAVIMYFTKGTVLGLFPLAGDEKGNDKYRIVANTNLPGIKKLFNDQEIKELVYNHTAKQCTVTEVLWSSPFWIHSKIAERLHQGRAFIAGDAAHVHSPAGAQGMNTGLQDIYNLAWKLALVIQKKADPSLLDSYQDERYRIMKYVVGVTHKLSFLALTTNRFVIAIRDFMMKNVGGRSKIFQDKLTKYVVQLAWNFRNSPIVDKDTKGRSCLPKPGDLAPNVQLQTDTTLFDSLRNTQHNLLIFTGLSPNAATLNNINLTYQWINAHAKELIKPHIIAAQKSDFSCAIDDYTLDIHHRYNVTKPCLCLIRPDRYIALFKEGTDYHLVQDFFNRIRIFLGSI
ncbi:FAD dependent oxidoreductase [Legionella santicrucis]|uniref:Alkyl hydroperoxide reductase subunit F n=1 Tax=Legionella santicrucis TaxID=45074 RepID=A0A0W0YI16_9GAMM|nr:FAD-dependent monooxygenase [Legionella santicrucis]KTD56589.1 FAD dependent oxidoreductase [Legionella santicrucis]